MAAESHVDRSITNPMEFIMANIVGTVNLLNAATNLNRAKFDTKIAELVLLQVSGQLLNAEF